MNYLKIISRYPRFFAKTLPGILDITFTHFFHTQENPLAYAWRTSICLSKGTMMMMTDKMFVRCVVLKRSLHLHSKFFSVFSAFSFRLKNFHSNMLCHYWTSFNLNANLNVSFTEILCTKPLNVYGIKLSRLNSSFPFTYKSVYVWNELVLCRNVL